MKQSKRQDNKCKFEGNFQVSKALKIKILLVSILCFILPIPSAVADSPNSLLGVQNALKHCSQNMKSRKIAGQSQQGYRNLDRVYRPPMTTASALIRDTGEIVHVGNNGEIIPGLSNKNNCDSIRSRENFADAKAHKVLFGDGNPSNGFEDDTELLSSAKEVAALVPSAVGKIECKQKVIVDGKIKTKTFSSSGSLINLGNKNHGTVVTTGHNLFDSNGNKFANCFFLPTGNYHDRVKLQIKDRYYGADSVSDLNEFTEFTFIKVPLELERKYGALPMGYIEENKLEELYDKGMKVELIGYSHKYNDMGISRKDCKVVQKKPGDYYYAENTRSIYLHSCDIIGGSSGGVLVATLGDKSVILGINIGIKINGNVHPADKNSFPSTGGAPEGLPFDPKSYAGIAITFRNPAFKRTYDKLKKE